MAHLIKILLIVSGAIIMASSCSKTEKDWKRLYNGENLDQWVQLNGEANYSEENGMIVGETELNTPNSFLCTKERYSDFIFKVDLKVDQGLNSGIQIRSNSIPEYKDDRVHGYQVEIDPSDRSYSGGIYDEARRGWLYNLDDNEAAREAFNNGEWNTFRIEALGDTIQTWVNGVPAANLVDNMTKEGFIGLQVHGIGDDEEKEGLQVRWRNMRIMTGDKAWANKKSMDIPQKRFLYNQLTEEEKNEGWKLLFNGRNHEGWRGYDKDHFPEKGWIAHNAALTVLADGGGGSIVTEDKFSEFDLKLDFRMTEAANSGIKYYLVDDSVNLGLEYQILDDEGYPDINTESNHSLSSLY
ncbi:MAG: 3-keto-disaccharide hydrolase, partial [Bacteroidota bacterium]